MAVTLPTAGSLAPEIDPLEQARVLAPEIEAAAASAEGEGTMPDGLVQAVADAGLFWIMVPRELGGLESDAATTIGVFEELSRADGSVGWSVMANASSACFASIYTDDEAAEAMFVDAGLGIHAGMFAPAGHGVAVDGGYQVDGRYQFGSGIGHATWVSAGFQELRDGEPVMTELGLPAMRVAFLPRDQVEVVGNWDVMGLEGTGSYDYIVDHRRVESAFTFALLEAVPRRGGPIYNLGLFGLVAMGHAGFALGVGRRALDEVLAIAREGRARLGADPVRDQQLFQHDFAMQDAAMRAARSYVFDAFLSAEISARDDGMPTLVETQRMRQATTYATRVAAEVARFAYTWSGSAGLRNPSVVGRCFRDISAATQHLYVDNNTLTAYTQALLA